MLLFQGAVSGEQCSDCGGAICESNCVQVFVLVVDLVYMRNEVYYSFCSVDSLGNTFDLKSLTK